MKPRNQLEGLILSRFSCNGRWSFIHFEYCVANIDTAWIHKTVQFFATLGWCVINTKIYRMVGYRIITPLIELCLLAIFSTSRLWLCPRPCDSLQGKYYWTVTSEKRRYDTLLAHWIASSLLLRKVNGVTNRSASLFCLFLLAWLVTLAREERRMSQTSEPIQYHLLFCIILQIKLEYCIAAVLKTRWLWEPFSPSLWTKNGRTMHTNLNIRGFKTLRPFFLGTRWFNVPRRGM